MKYILNSIFLLILFASCNSHNVNQNKTNDWQAYKNIGDSILKSVSAKERLVFAEIGNGNYKQVLDIDNFNEAYTSFINVIDDSKIKIYIEVPYSESGDWNNEYIYIFGEEGKLKLFIRTSSFFNSICTDGVLTEKEIFSIESDHLIKKEHKIYDENNAILEDTANCIFNYRFEYPVYLNYYELPVIKQNKDIFNK